MIAHDVIGWMSDEELGWLAEKAKSAHVIIELGSWKGRSAVCFAEHTPGVVFCIDHYNGSTDNRAYHELTDEKYGKATVINAFLTATQEFRDKGKLFLVEATTVEGLALLATVLARRPADLIFVDADHCTEAVEADVRASLPLLRKGGLLCGHDYLQSDVSKGVGRVLPSVERGAGSIWWWVKP